MLHNRRVETELMFFPLIFSEKAHMDPTAGLCALTQMKC